MVKIVLDETGFSPLCMLGEETVSEDVYLTPDSMEKDMELFAQIQKIKENPYIVLITPDINTLESLTKEYNRFLDLIPKNKRISNEYSLQLFGLDVYNMYSKMLAKITNGDYCINNSSYSGSLWQY